MGWRSQEQAYQMRRRMKRVRSETGTYDDKEVVVQKTKKKHHYGAEDVIPEGLPDYFFDENGEVNLSKVKLKDALKYMNTIGIKFPTMDKNRSKGIYRDVEKPPTMEELFGGG